VEIFNQGLNDKRGVLALNKVDLVSNRDDLNSAKGEMQVFGLPVFLISAKEKAGLGDLVAEVHRLATEALPEEEPGLPTPVIFRPRPVDGGRMK
jgi:GTP-binding protein